MAPSVFLKGLFPRILLRAAAAFNPAVRRIQSAVSGSQDEIERQKLLATPCPRFCASARLRNARACARML